MNRDETNIIKELGKALSQEKDFLEAEHKKLILGLLPTNKLFKDFYVNLDIARTLSVYDFFQRITDNGKKPLEILVVDDNPQKFIHILKKFYILKKVYKRANNQKIIRTDIFKFTVCEDLKNVMKKIKNGNIKNYDITLLDLHFGFEQSSNGSRLLTEIKWKIPGMPIFILTKSHDIEIIKEMFEKEAEFFITKSRIAGLPWFIYKFLNNYLGELIFELADHRRAFLHTITKWTRNRTYLWHGEKTYQMVEHTVAHSKMLWRIIEQFYQYGKLSPMCQNNRAKEILYALLLSIWLHDIGYKGYREIIQPYKVRKYHAVISGELIWEDFKKWKKDERQYWGEFVDRRSEDSENAEHIERIVRYTAILSAFHMRKAPVDKTSVKQLGGEHEIDNAFRYPSEFEFLKELYTGERKEGALMYIEDFIPNSIKKEKEVSEEVSKNLKFAAAILRIADAIDKGVHRVGRIAEEDAQMRTTIEDTIFYVKDAIKEIESIEDKIRELKYQRNVGDPLYKLKNYMIGFNDWLKREYKGLLSKTNHSLRTKPLNDESYIRLYNCVTGHAEKLRSSINRLKSVLASSLLQRLELLIEQIIFLLNCPLHFYTHRTVEEPAIALQSDKLVIQYTFNDRFVNVDKNNLKFAEFNRLLQEGWKIYTDIFEEYFPIEHILKDNRCEISHVEFLTESSTKEVWLRFELSPRFIEIERKVKLTDEREFQLFLDKLKEVVGVRKKRNKNKEIIDQFFDTKDNILRKHGWTIRHRTVDGQEKKMGIKIKPVFWQREVEYRLEFPPCSSDSYQIKGKSLGDVLQQFANYCKDFKTVMPIIEDLKFNEHNEQLSKILDYKQKREELTYNINGLHINITADKVIYNKHKLYIVEFEPIQGNPVERENALNQLWTKLRKVFTDIDEKVYSETKFDWAERQKQSNT